MDEAVEIRIPEIWDDTTFKQDEWGDLNYLIGPNGTGKSLFAERLETELGSYSVRHLRADRLSGMSESNSRDYFTSSGLSQGFNLGQEEDYLRQAQSHGYSSDAYVLLRNKPDLKIRIQAILSEYFDRNIRLEEEGGYMVPVMVDEPSSSTYDLRKNESHGLKELIGLLTVIYDDEPDIIILDEPELHLHPQYQKFLLNEIQSIAGPPDDTLSKTFFVITHSPSMIHFRDTADIMNTYSFRDKSRPPYSVDALSAEDEYHIKRLLPRIDTQHKEALFSLEPILVEGYTDKQVFSLSIEKHDDLRMNPASTIVSLDGKDNVSSFFRFCQELGLHPRVIVDLDAIFHGRLRQTLSGIDEVNLQIQDIGAGSNLMDYIGSVDSSLGTLVKGLENRENIDGLGKSLVSAKDHIDRIEENYKRRYILYRAIQSDSQAACEEFGQDNVRKVTGGVNNILNILRNCDYYFLNDGELEDYLAEDIPLNGPSEERKRALFQDARNNLLSAESSDDVSATVNGLVDVISDILQTREVSLLSHMEGFVSQWAHNVQTAVMAGEVQTKDDLLNHSEIGDDKHQRLFKVQDITVTDNGFQCVIQIDAALDPNETILRFTDDDVPSKITLNH